MVVSRSETMWEEMDCVRCDTRYPGEYANLKDFITPKHLMVQDLAASFNGGIEERVFDIWRWVGENIKYPWMQDGYEYRRLEAFVEPLFVFHRPAVILESKGDFWDYPSEVLTIKVSDCDGTAFLLASLLLNHLGPDQVFAAVGNIYKGFPQGHAWVVVEMNGSHLILESTKKDFTNAVAPVEEVAAEYQPIYYANHEKMYRLSEGEILAKCYPCCPLWI